MYKMQCRIFSSIYIKKKHGRVSNSICMCEKRQGLLPDPGKVQVLYGGQVDFSHRGSPILRLCLFTLYQADVKPCPCVISVLRNQNRHGGTHRDVDIRFLNVFPPVSTYKCNLPVQMYFPTVYNNMILSNML